MMKLKNILKNTEILETNKNLDCNLEYNGISYDSRQIKENFIFVAIKGYVTDGHKYIEVAKKNGAKLVIVEDFVDIDILQIKVKNTRITLADIAKNFYNDPTKDINVVGITATNGKTTTSFMVKKIFDDAKLNSGIIGTVFTKYDDVFIPSVLTTPESLELQKYFNDMKNKNINYVVMEVSSSAQELYRAKNIDFDIVTFNNFSREHIDQHGSYENYYKFKSKLIREAKSSAIAILNSDFEKIIALKDETNANVLTFSLKNLESDFGIENLDLSTGLATFDFLINRDIEISNLKLKKNKFKIELGSVGYSSVMNSVVAIIITLCMKIDIETIKKALKAFKGVERRFELIYDEKYKILDDHFANEKNIDSTMQTLEKMKYKNLHILYAIRGNRGVELNREVAQKIADYAKILKPKTILATKSIDKVSKKDKVSNDELNIFNKTMNENKMYVEVIDTLEEGVNKILANAKEDDIVLLAGCQGMDKGALFVKKNLLENNLVKDVEGFCIRIDSRIC